MPILGPLVVLAVLALYRLDAKSLWFDEIFSVQTAGSGFRAIASAAAHGEANMVLYYAILRTWLELGQGEAWVRLLSVLFALATVPVMYVLGRMVDGKFTGALAAGLFAVNAFVVQFAQEARSYTLTMLLVSVSLVLLLVALRGGRRLAWVAFAASSTLALYAHFFAAFTLLAAAIAVTFRPPSRRDRVLGLGAVAVVAILALPLVLVVLTYPRNLTWVGPITPEVVGETLATVAGSGAVPGQEGPLAWLVAASVLGLAADGALSAFRSPTRRFDGPLLVLAITVPLAGAALVSLATSIYVPRFFAVVVPPLLVLAATGLRRHAPGRRAVGLAVIVALMMQGVSVWYVDHPKTDWRAATAYVAAEASRTDRLIVYEDWNHPAFDYYWHRLADGANAPTRIWRGLGTTDSAGYAAALRDALSSEVVPGQRVWLVLVSGSRGAPQASDPSFGPLRERYSEGLSMRFDRLVVIRFDSMNGTAEDAPG